MISRDEALRSYPALGQLIGGDFRRGGGRKKAAVIDPALNTPLADYEAATETDIDDALSAVVAGNKIWRAKPAIERARVLQAMASTMREQRDMLAGLVTLELGKPYRESLIEVELAASMFDWGAEEGKRAYGRVIPSREQGARQFAIREPIGPIAGFVSWNAPLTTPSRKISGALGAGCSIILKASEETPACALEIGRIAYECGLPEGVLSILVGDPILISGKLLGSDVIRGVTFTGSTAVGKELASKAVASMKRPIMELGGHAPVLVFGDVDFEKTVNGAISAKFRNSGQICVSPTRFLVQTSVYNEFTARMAEAASELVVGNGFDPSTTMGPLANKRRVDDMETFVRDARDRGACIVTGGSSIDRQGAFFEPTVLADVSTEALVSNIEPFGPIASISPFTDLDEAISTANRLPFGLASYVMTNNIQTAHRCASEIEAGIIIVNSWRASLPETPFGGHKDSGLALEGGVEGIQAFQNTKFIYQI